MTKPQRFINGNVISAGAILLLTWVLLAQVFPNQGALQSAIIVFVQAGLLWWLRRPSGNSAAQSSVEGSQQTVVSPEQQFAEWQQKQMDVLLDRQSRLEERERDLIQRFARFQEFLEYPQEPDIPHDDVVAARLTEQDRQVQGLLEAEAERVYNRIRSNGYSQNGSVDIIAIRSEVLDLVQRIARIYSPDSHQPLLETSFEQLARSASRICLHALVLLERLPLDVKSYNINQLHGYLRKAVQSYGTYQQVTPWLKHLSRAAYGGRLAAGANPLTLGAWWLATEVGRRGAQKVVENVVDKQAVAVLHDIVTVIGAEVANVYGPGFRQRSAGWVYGTELAELLKRFPVSREALQEGLKEVTALPLHSEYDRVYLYRCLAGHRSAGLRIQDAATLSRTERDRIARQLEHFFDHYVHGATPKEVRLWQEDVEARLDLKISLGQTQVASSDHLQTVAAVRSVYGFLTSAVNLDAEEAIRQLEHGHLLAELPLDQRTVLLDELSQQALPFQPPDLDPAAPLTGVYLDDIMEAVVESRDWDDHLEQLALETAQYFRRPHDQAKSLFTETCRRSVTQRTTADAKLTLLQPGHLKPLLTAIPPELQVSCVFGSVSLQKGASVIKRPEDVVVVLSGSDHRAAQLLLLSAHSASPLWTCVRPWAVSREKGYVFDDCRITGGTWTDLDTSADTVILAGSVTGGGYERMFGPLLITE